jgi:hypothetical protein
MWTCDWFLNTDGKVRFPFNAGNLLSSSGNFSKLRTILFRDLETVYRHICWPGSVVGIATAYWLDGLGIESRWWVEIFRTCPDRPWGPTSLLYNGYRVFPGGKVRPGREVDHSPPSSAEVKNRVELYRYSPFVACERVNPTYNRSLFAHYFSLCHFFNGKHGCKCYYYYINECKLKGWSCWTRELSIRVWGTERIIYVLLRYYYYYLSPSFRVFTIT